MRILAISDIHGKTSNLKEIVEEIVAKNIVLDMVIIVGDISANTIMIPISENPSIVTTIANLLLPLAPTYAILGNDDDPTLEELLEENGIISLENKIINKGKWSFVGWGGTVDKTVLKYPNGEVSIRKLEGINTWQEEIIEKELKPIFDQIEGEQHFCVVTHYHPDGIVFPKYPYPQIGSIGLAKMLDEYKPDLWLCAHIHWQTGFHMVHEPTQTQIIRVSSVDTGYHRKKNRYFGKAYWLIDLFDNGNVETQFYELVDQNI